MRLKDNNENGKDTKTTIMKQWVGLLHNATGVSGCRGDER
jgi:hypothetical protein